MKVYRLLHKPTGLYYQLYKAYNVSNLGPKGKIYKGHINLFNGFYILIKDGSSYIRLKITTGLYKKIKDKLDYSFVKKNAFPDMEDNEWNDRYATWECYAPISDFEVVESEI